MSKKDAKIIGQLNNASNATLLVSHEDQHYVYKPKSGERELWDFPDGTLYQRERAMFVLSELIGWDVIPKTIISEGPLGIGSFQEWKEAEILKVDIFEPNFVPEDWLNITSGVDETGKVVTLAHSQDSDLIKIALLDAIANNADRKAGHLLTDADDKTWGIDHGVTFNTDPKLRTVLWGWLGTEIPENLLSELVVAANNLEISELSELLTQDEVNATIERLTDLLETGIFPAPNPNWPAVPWPVF